MQCFLKNVFHNSINIYAYCTPTKIEICLYFEGSNLRTVWISNCSFFIGFFHKTNRTLFFTPIWPIYWSILFVKISKWNSWINYVLIYLFFTCRIIIFFRFQIYNSLLLTTAKIYLNILSSQTHINYVGIKLIRLSFKIQYNAWKWLYYTFNFFRIQNLLIVQL